MDDKLANDLINEYEKRCKEIGIEIVNVKYGGRATTLIVKIDGEEKEHVENIGGGTVLDSHVAALRTIYWMKKDPPPVKEERKVDPVELEDLGFSEKVIEETVAHTEKEIFATQEKKSNVYNDLQLTPAQALAISKAIKEKSARPEIKPLKPVEEKMGTLTYKDIYKQ